MSEKYYTPSIQEFHVGFEYEVNYGNNNWVKESLYSKEQVNVLPFMNTNNIRVKYLNKEDIESLGWKSSDRLIREFYIKDKNVVYYLNSIPNGKIHIKQEWNPYKEVVNTEDLFIGYLKNKSELQRLMKQLGI